MNRRAFLLMACLFPASTQAARRELIFVVHPYDTPSRLYTRFRPLTLYLGGVLDCQIKLVIASTYDEQIVLILSHMFRHLRFVILGACRT